MLRYTKPNMSSKTPALTDAEGKIAITREDKETMIRKAPFPHPLEDPVRQPPPREGTAYQKVEAAAVHRALHNQAQAKAPGLDRLNFRAFMLLWWWDSERVVSPVR